MSSSKSKWYSHFIYDGFLKVMAFMLLTLGLSSYLGYLIPELLVKLSENYSFSTKYYETIQVFLFVYIASYILRASYQISVNIYIRDIVGNVRNKLFVNWLLNYEIERGNKKDREYPQGEVIARIMSDGLAIRELVTSGAFIIIFDFCFVFSFLISFINLNKTTGIYLAIIEVVFAFLLVWGGRFMTEVYQQMRKSKGYVSQTVANVVGGLSENYFNAHHNYSSKKGKWSFDDFLKKQMHANVWDAGYYSIAESLYPLLLAFVVFIFPYSEIKQGAIILALVELIQRSINPIKSIAGKVTNIQRAATGLKRINDFLFDLDTGLSSQLERQVKRLELDVLEVNVKNFSYTKQDSRDTFHLKDIYFKGTRGESIGIVGLSGAGKSTLLNIIAGQIIPQKGDVTFKSDKNEVIKFAHDGSPEQLMDYREQVGLISQDSHIFSASLGFNICFSQEVNQELIDFWNWITDKIDYLKKWGVGLDDQISPRSLSAGQNQLISAIRSCYLKKPVVLLDEISSALDSDLELALREVVLLIQKNSLTLIVAHRIETTMSADRIIVLDSGTLLDEGNHQVLMERSPQYKEFVSQLIH